jgi:TolB protein
MSQNPVEYHLPIPGGSEPEEQPPKNSPKRILILLALVLLAAIVVGAFLVLQDDDDVDSMVVEADTPTPKPTESLSTAIPATVISIPTPARIAFIGQDSRLATVNPDGSDLRLLTEPGRFYQFPAWSPTDKAIAAIGSDFDGAGVYTVNDRDGAPLHQLYTTRERVPIYLYWSPDGANVSFIAQHPDGLALHLSPAGGTAGSEILATGQGSFFWNWAPGSQEILIHTGFTASEQENSRLAFVPLDSAGEVREVTQSGFFQAPGISFDGSYYSFADADPIGNHWLTVWNDLEDQQERLLNYRGVVAMGWSPNKDKLAYTSPDSPATTFYGPLKLLDIEKGDSRLLVSEQILAFFWSPNGQTIAYLTLAGIEELQEEQEEQANGIIRPGTLMRTTNPFAGSAGSQNQEQLQIQPRRRVYLNLVLVEVETGEQSELLTFEPSDVFLNQFMPFFDQYALSHSLWSPDSRSLIIPMKNEEEEPVVVVVPTDGSEPLAIADGDIAFWANH